MLRWLASVCCLFLLLGAPIVAQEQKPARILLVLGGGHDYKKFSVTLDKLCTQAGGLKIARKLELGEKK